MSCLHGKKLGPHPSAPLLSFFSTSGCRSHPTQCRTVAASEDPTGGGAEATQVWRKCVALAPSQAAWCTVTPRARLRGAAGPNNTVAYTASTAPPYGSAGTSGAILATSLGSSVASSSTPALSCSATVKVTASSGWSGGDEG
uniref:Uncharacterized protein n=1 Tax=Oryza sativa subsp. japonica TaxID=39947 RepID=Q2RBQ0_ORYSJ|nr:hypothetical protein LOC_Os11g01250 [Oryza sativa Japonica Group]